MVSPVSGTWLSRLSGIPRIASAAWALGAFALALAFLRAGSGHFLNPLLGMSVVLLCLAAACAEHLLAPLTFRRRIRWIHRQARRRTLEPKESFFSNEVIGFLTPFAVALVPAVICAWIVHVSGAFGAWALAGFGLVAIQRLLGWSQAFVFVLLTCFPLTVIHLLVGNLWLGGGFLPAVATIILVFDRRRRLRFRGGRPFRRVLRKILGPVRVVLFLSRSLARSVFSARETLQVQALVALLLILGFVATPRLVGIGPPEVNVLLLKVTSVLKRGEPYLTEIAFVLYFGLSVMPMVGFLSEPWSAPKQETGSPSLWRTTIAILLLGVLLVPFIVVLALAVALAFVGLGRQVLAGDFALVLGFFVFPRWFMRGLAFFVGLVLLLYPDHVLRRWSRVPAKPSGAAVC